VKEDKESDLGKLEKVIPFTDVYKVLAEELARKKLYEKIALAFTSWSSFEQFQGVVSEVADTEDEEILIYRLLQKGLEEPRKSN
jgi:hypothetical protein